VVLHDAFLAVHGRRSHATLPGLEEENRLPFEHATSHNNKRREFIDQCWYDERLAVLGVSNTKIPWQAYGDTLFMLNGWSGTKAKEETQKYAKELDLIRRAKQINGRAVMLVGANTSVIPYELHIAPLLAALKETKDSKISFKLIDDDHSFNSTRAELIETTVNFLNNNCNANE
jgi:DNA-directed RNA polymerase subunit K/omega